MAINPISVKPAPVSYRQPIAPKPQAEVEAPAADSAKAAGSAGVAEVSSAHETDDRAIGGRRAVGAGPSARPGRARAPRARRLSGGARRGLSNSGACGRGRRALSSATAATKKAKSALGDIATNAKRAERTLNEAADVLERSNNPAARRTADKLRELARSTGKASKAAKDVKDYMSPTVKRMERADKLVQWADRIQETDDAAIELANAGNLHDRMRAAEKIADTFGKMSDAASWLPAPADEYLSGAFNMVPRTVKHMNRITEAYHAKIAERTGAGSGEIPSCGSGPGQYVGVDARLYCQDPVYKRYVDESGGRD